MVGFKTFYFRAKPISMLLFEEKIYELALGTDKEKTATYSNY